MRNQRVEVSKATVTIRQLERPAERELAHGLFREYLPWVFSGLESEYGIRFDDNDAAVERHHRDFRAKLDRMRNGRGRLLLASIDGAPAGVCALKPVTANIAEIKRLYVRPSARGCGIGRALLTRLLADARAERFDLVRLETLSFMKAARHLYESLGFIACEAFAGSEMGAAGFEELACFMQIALSPPSKRRSAGRVSRLRSTAASLGTPSHAEYPIAAGSLARAVPRLHVQDVSVDA